MLEKLVSRVNFPRPDVPAMTNNSYICGKIHEHKVVIAFGTFGTKEAAKVSTALGDAKSVKMLLEKVAQPDTRSPAKDNWVIYRGSGPLKHEFTALHVAAWHGDVELINALTEYGASVNPKTEPTDGVLTPLHFASFRGNVKAVQCLVEHGADIHMMATVRHVKRNALIIAVSRGEQEIVADLLGKGVSVDSRRLFDSDPPRPPAEPHAFLLEEHLKLVNEYIERQHLRWKRREERRYKLFDSALSVALGRNWSDCAKTLLSGASCRPQNRCSARTQARLMKTFIRNQSLTDRLRQLALAGIDVNQAWASEIGSVVESDERKPASTVRGALEISSRQAGCPTALHYAIFCMNHDAVHGLLDNGADHKYEPSHGVPTDLEFAYCKGDLIRWPTYLALTPNACRYRLKRHLNAGSA